MGEKLLFFILLLGVLVLVHELGHFTVAKLCGVQIFKFSIGFGPELFGLRLGETRYAVSAIPLGGFVRMAGEDDVVERWGGLDAPPADPARLLTAKPRWQRAAIILAGPLANLILPMVLFSVAAHGENEVAAPVVGTVLPGTPAERAGMLSGDRIRRIDGEPIRAFGDIATQVAARGGERVTLELERQGQPLVVELTLHQGTGIDALQRVQARGRVGVGAFRRLPVVAPLPGSLAAGAGLQALDRVLSVDGAAVETFDALERVLAAAADRSLVLEVERSQMVLSGALELDLPQRIQLTLPPATEPVTPPPTPRVLGRRAGVELGEVDEEHLQATVEQAQRLLDAQPASLRGLMHGGACLAGVLQGSPASQLGLRRGDCALSLDREPAFHWSVVDERLAAAPTAPHLAVVARGGLLDAVAFRLQEREELVPIRRGQQRRVFGAVQTPSVTTGATEIIVRGPVAAVVEGVGRTLSLTGVTIVGMGLLLSAQLPFATVGGPMMLFDLAGRSAERGAATFFFIMAFISINLAVLNLLPVPVLDGGHLLFIAIEVVRRKPLPRRAAEIANLVGLSLLLLLMVAVMGNDLARYWGSIAGAFR